MEVADKNIRMKTKEYLWTQGKDRARRKNSDPNQVGEKLATASSRSDTGQQEIGAGNACLSYLTHVIGLSLIF